MTRLVETDRKSIATENKRSLQLRWAEKQLRVNKKPNLEVWGFVAYFYWRASIWSDLYDCLCKSFCFLIAHVSQGMRIQFIWTIRNVNTANKNPSVQHGGNHPGIFEYHGWNKEGFRSGNIPGCIFSPRFWNHNHKFIRKFQPLTSVKF